MDRDQLGQAMHISPAEVAKQLDHDMLDYLKSMNRDRLVFGLSGGIQPFWRSCEPVLCPKIRSWP